MDFDAFNAGIEPGGLRSKSDIRVLLCYILCSTKAPLPEKDIIEVMQENGFANYFEVMDSLASLQKMGSITAEGQSPVYYSANETTKEISRRLHTTLPLSVREKATTAALNLLAAAKREQENQVEITDTGKGYQVTCHISDGSADLMTFSLYVPDYTGAKLVKKNFLKDPTRVYRLFLALMTENTNAIKDILSQG